MSDQQFNPAYLEALKAVQVKFGLRGQGVLPAVVEGIRDGQTLRKIARDVGWEEQAFRANLADILAEHCEPENCGQTTETCCKAKEREDEHD